MPCPRYIACSRASIITEADEHLPQSFVDVCVDDGKPALWTSTSEPAIAGTIVLHTNDTAMGVVAGITGAKEGKDGPVDGSYGEYACCKICTLNVRVRRCAQSPGLESQVAYVLRWRRI